MIILREEGDKFLVELGERGEKAIKEIRLGEFNTKKKKPWDGIWRVVVFDIPNRKRNVREALRQQLKEFEFYQLQKSVWVSPYPCEEEMVLVTEIFDIFPFINFLETKKIKNDLELRKHFKLL